jgi:hypothetical protein
VATNAYITGPITLVTEGTATNHAVTKAYVDDLHWKSYNLIAPAAPPYGGDTGTRSQPAITVTNANNNSLVYMAFDESVDQYLGPYYIAVEEVRTNVNWEVDLHYFTDGTGTTVMAIGYVRGLEEPTWYTNNCPASVTTSVFSVESFDIDANIANDTSTRWYIKRVGTDASDTQVGAFNFVNGLLNIPLEK